MGSVRHHPPVLHLVAVFSQFPEALAEARTWIEATWGTIALRSEEFDFRETDYYARSMGLHLKKQFVALAPLAAPEALVERKRASNEFESAMAERGTFSVDRPVNLDPGYLTESKLILASTKDHAHRIFLGQGVFAEITLAYRRHAWQGQPWTYPDYLRSDYHAFFDACRAYYRRAKGTALPPETH